MRQQIIDRGEDPATYPIFGANACPDLWSDLVWLWEAFTTLTATRQQGFNGPQPITLVEVLAYCSYRGITSPEEREELLHFTQHLDGLYLADFAAKSKAASKTK